MHKSIYIYTHIWTCSPKKNNDAIWCILKCFFKLKSLGKNSLRIATTTKRAASLSGGGEYRAYSLRKILKEMVQLSAQNNAIKRRKLGTVACSPEKNMQFVAFKSVLFLKKNKAATVTWYFFKCYITGTLYSSSLRLNRF